MAQSKVFSAVVICFVPDVAAKTIDPVLVNVIPETIVKSPKYVLGRAEHVPEKPVKFRPLQAVALLFVNDTVSVPATTLKLMAEVIPIAES